MNGVAGVACGQARTAEPSAMTAETGPAGKGCVS